MASTLIPLTSTKGKQMALYKFVFDKYHNEVEIESWVVEADRMDKQVASDIARSVCMPHEFGSVHFTVYEMAAKTEGEEWKLFTDEDKCTPKKLFSTTVWEAEDTLDILVHNLRQDPDNPTLTDEQLEDLLISLKANRQTFLRGMRAITQ